MRWDLQPGCQGAGGGNAWDSYSEFTPRGRDLTPDSAEGLEGFEFQFGGRLIVILDFALPTPSCAHGVGALRTGGMTIRHARSVGGGDFSGATIRRRDQVQTPVTIPSD